MKLLNCCIMFYCCYRNIDREMSILFSPKRLTYKVTQPFCANKMPQHTMKTISFLRKTICFRHPDIPGLHRYDGKMAVISDSRENSLEYYILSSSTVFGVPEEFRLPIFAERALNAILYSLWNVDNRVAIIFTTSITNPSGEAMKYIRVLPDTPFKVSPDALSGNVVVQEPRSDDDDDDDDDDYDDYDDWE